MDEWNQSFKITRLNILCEVKHWFISIDRGNHVLSVAVYTWGFNCDRIIIELYLEDVYVAHLTVPDYNWIIIQYFTQPSNKMVEKVVARIHQRFRPFMELRENTKPDKYYAHQLKLVWDKISQGMTEGGRKERSPCFRGRNFFFWSKQLFWHFLYSINH